MSVQLDESFHAVLRNLLERVRDDVGEHVVVNVLMVDRVVVPPARRPPNKGSVHPQSERLTVNSHVSLTGHFSHYITLYRFWSAQGDVRIRCGPCRLMVEGVCRASRVS